MNPVDLQSVIQWWFVLLVLGAGFLPLTILIFKNFFDRGYIFSKIIGLGILSYVSFLIGVFHIAPFRTETIFILGILLIAGFFFITKKYVSVLTFIKQHWAIILFEEALFFTTLLAWAYIHAFAPDVHGLEKYMDYGFINSILRSDYFPPKDMWFAPHVINYYYFGHLMTALLTKISFIPSNITFNLMLSTIFALCFTQTFSIGANLFVLMKQHTMPGRIKRVIAGIMTAGVVALGGNLHILYAFFKPYQTDNPQPFWTLPFFPLDFPNGYWYPNATRYIFNTIHEFPIYSWVVADLHGHVLDIPLVLFIIALLLALFHQEHQTEATIQVKKKSYLTYFSVHPLWSIGIGLTLALMYMTNAWDGAIYLLLTILVLFSLYNALPKHKIHTFILSFALVFLSFILFALPYNSYFTPSAVSGIGVLCAPQALIDMGKFGPFLFEKDHCQHSYWWELLTLYGFFYFFIICFLVFAVRAKKLLETDLFVLLLITLGTILIIIPEFVYLKDIYPAHYRANTMFKLVFQAFMILGISSMYILFRLGDRKPPAIRAIFRYPFLFVSVVLLVAVMQYPKIAINSYYGDLKDYKGLDGTVYLKTLYPTDYDAILWMNKNIKGQPVILEAQGDSYTDFARVSANTGLPTVLGWTVHEWLWRGSYDVPAPRIDEIKTMYETQDLAKTKELLDKYNVEYVFIGSMEYQKHPELVESKFDQLGDMVFEKGTTKIYRIYK
ncbi:MAG: DUF2298 domain-containing protein [Patescibacteria group bacterium]